MALSIPVVDLCLPEGLLEEGRQVPRPSTEVAEAVCAACRDVGFLYIRQHGIKATTVSTLVQESRKFFALSEEEKMRVARHRWNEKNEQVYRGYFPADAQASSAKEGLDVGPRWERCASRLGERAIFAECNVSLSLPLQTALRHYYTAASQLGCFLMRCIALGLGVAEEHFDSLFTHSVSTLRLLHYPALAHSSGLSCSQHTDSGMVTILWQDEAGGLQVEAEGHWVDVPPLPATFVVNLGDLLARWTGNAFKATLHRVRRCPGERLSVPFFLEPSASSVIAPLPLPGLGDHFDEIVYGDWLWEKIKKEFDEFKEQG